MTLSNSSWDRERVKGLKSPAFILHPARVIHEFANRGTRKIFQHSLGRVDFNERGINPARDEVINSSYGERTLSGYRYPSISHTHTLPTLLSDELEVLAHGAPVKGGWENCAMAGMTCLEGDSDTRCEVGKCVIGRVVRDGERWKFESYTVPELYYYVYGEEYVDLLSVMRGSFSLPGGAGVVPVPRMASTATRVYLPPQLYSRESFVRRVIKSLEPESLQDSLNIFVRSVLGSDILATVGVERKTYERVESTVNKVLPSVWAGFVIAELDEIWRERVGLTNRDFLVQVYNTLELLYKRAVQASGSSIRGGRVDVDGNISRPVYNRLPGVSGAYNNDSPGEDVAAWLTSGADMELSDSKTRIDWFYDTFLNPDTCYPLNLDWIAQHMGFFGGMWNLEWDAGVKRLLIANAHKNEIVEGGMWTLDPEQDTLRGLDLSQIREGYYRKTLNINTQLVEIEEVEELKVDVSSWPGLIPSRGSLLSLLFMFWAFGIRAVREGELMQNEQGEYVVRSGLRQVEFDAPVNLPVVTDVIHVGSEQDAEVGVYANQLIADVSPCQDVNSANSIVVRMPFYYNRDGRSWDAARGIVEGWMPGTAAKRLQYGYSAADLFVAEDVFYEP
jgi:hypothetical protein